MAAVLGRGCAAFAASMAVAAMPATAQAPGYPQVDIGAVRAEYNAEVILRINEHLAKWGTAWATDQVDALMELYWEDAILMPPDGSIRRGRDAIREYFLEALSEHGHIEAFMLDFDASGGMAQVFGNYMLGIQQGPQAGQQKAGPMLTVYAQRSRRWRIRSQVFMPQN